MIYMDMDAFFASIEQRDHPRLRGRPTLVCHTDHDPERTDFGVVAAASYEARRYGVRSGSTVTEAKQRLGSDAAWVPADYEKYLPISRAAYDLCNEFGPTEAASVDEFFLELADPSYESELIAGQELQRRVRADFNLSSTVGAGYSKLSAKMIAETVKPTGVAQVKGPEQFLNHFAGQPVTEMPGIAHRMERNLNFLGIFTIGDLAEADPHKLVKRFGVNGWGLWQAGRGKGGGRVTPGFKRRRVRSVGHSASLRKVRDIGELEKTLLGLCTGIAQRLRAQNSTARTVHTWIAFEHTFSRGEQRTLPYPVSLAGPLYQVAVAVLYKHGHLLKDFSASAIGVHAMGLSGGLQLAFEQERDMRVALAVDQVNKRFGERTIWPAVLLDWRREYHAVPRTEVA